MKLMTEVYDSGGGGRDLYFTRQSQVEHDAAAAHALVRAIAEWKPLAQEGWSAGGAVRYIEKLADELMAEWGFDREDGNG